MPMPPVMVAMMVRMVVVMMMPMVRMPSPPPLRPHLQRKMPRRQHRNPVRRRNPRRLLGDRDAPMASIRTPDPNPQQHRRSTPPSARSHPTRARDETGDELARGGVGEDDGAQARVEAGAADGKRLRGRPQMARVVRFRQRRRVRAQGAVGYELDYDRHLAGGVGAASGTRLKADGRVEFVRGMWMQRASVGRRAGLKLSIRTVR